MKSSTAALAAIATSFVAVTHANPVSPAKLDQILIYIPDLGKPLAPASDLSDTGFRPIDFNGVAKIEEESILLMASTKCCSSGTCDDYNLMISCILGSGDPRCY